MYVPLNFPEQLFPTIITVGYNGLDYSKFSFTVFHELSCLSPSLPPAQNVPAHFYL